MECWKSNENLEKYNKDFIIELILNLVGTLEKDLLEVKLNINTQCRIAATYFTEQLANPGNDELWWLFIAVKTVKPYAIFFQHSASLIK